MKKFLLTIAMFCGFACANAQEAGDTRVYEDVLYVTVNGGTTGPYDAKVNVSMNADGTIRFALDNFVLITEDGDEAAVGNIVVPSLAVTPVGNTYEFNFYDGIDILPGTLEGVDFWMGPELGTLPTRITGKLNDHSLYVVIDIETEMLGTIHVEYGTEAYVSDCNIYKDELYVTVNGSTTGPYKATVMVSQNEDGTINFGLNNFILETEDGDVMPVGNIVVPNLAVTPVSEKALSFNFDDIIVVQEGTAPVYDFWAGPSLGELPTKISGVLSETDLYVVIDIDAKMLGDVIHVEFGKEENVTPVQRIEAEQKPAFVGVFDLSGRSVSKDFKGMRIVNGKKVLR